MSGRRIFKFALLGFFTLLLGVSVSGTSWAQTHNVLGEFGTTST